ncbi:MAG: sigma-54-dependent Fis family transcriptional regulator [Verrucomicrobia bacterium]|nr:sigma-54-dependent Fis family transcriptional regulator [Verrucomicrobiota bacterium]
MPPADAISSLRMLLVDDDPASLHLLERFVETEGFEVATARNAEEAERIALELQPHLVITDIILPGKDGFALLARFKEKLPQTEVMLLTGHASVERAVEAIRDGACDYIEKPVNRSRLIASLRKARQQIALRLENLDLRERLTAQAREMLVGQSAAIEGVRRTIGRVAGGNMSVFIAGESGTGKEIAAEMLHRLGARAREPLVKVSCAAIPENLLESEMFGYEKGAFTGASQAKAGKFEMAHRGTLFLDEIGEMNPGLQAKLLRVLQDGQFTRLGGNEVRSVDVRVVSATNVEVEKAIGAGKFREDLFYRLNVVHLRMPSLREHLDDVPLLAAHFLGLLRRKLNIEKLEISSEALKLLQSHSWPGNVRELANAMERATALRRGSTLETSDFALGAESVPKTPAFTEKQLVIELGTPLEAVEDRMIRAALAACGGDKEKAAAMLGISARTIYRKLGEG